MNPRVSHDDKLKLHPIFFQGQGSRHLTFWHWNYFFNFCTPCI